MKKIPTMFVRGKDGKITPEIAPRCEWVMEGLGKATEKIDGTNIRVTVRSGECVRVERRRNPTKIQKKKGIIEPWYVEAYQTDPVDKYVFRAIENTSFAEIPDGEHCCEAYGPKIQGNPLGLEANALYFFDLGPTLIDVPDRTFSGLKKYLDKQAPMEGIVFHGPDGLRAKIKHKDFLRKGGKND